MPEHQVEGADNVSVGSDLLRTGFATTADSANGTVVLTLEGELDMATSPALGQAINRALDARPSTLCLDLTGLSFLDSTGIRVLIAGTKRAEVEGCSFVLRSPSRSTLKALRLTGVDRLMTIEGLPSG